MCIIVRCDITDYFLHSGSTRYLHTLSLLGPSLLSFGGCRDTQDCFSSDLELYNVQCNTWETLKVPGLMSNDSRLKHSATWDSVDRSLLVFGGYVGTLRGDMLRLVHGNCSRWNSLEECEETAGPLCAWEGEEMTGSCVPIGAATITNSYYFCPSNGILLLSTTQQTTKFHLNFYFIDSCSPNLSCSQCLSSENCKYSACLNDTQSSSTCPNSTSRVHCPSVTDCSSCQLLGCSWERTGGTRRCYQPSSPASESTSMQCLVFVDDDHYQLSYMSMCEVF